MVMAQTFEKVKVGRTLRDRTWAFRCDNAYPSFIQSGYESAAEAGDAARTHLHDTHEHTLRVTAVRVTEIGPLGTRMVNEHFHALSSGMTVRLPLHPMTIAVEVSVSD